MLVALCQLFYLIYILGYKLLYYIYLRQVHMARLIYSTA